MNGQTVTPEQSYQNLLNFIGQFDCLQESTGEVHRRNTCREPWSDRFDLRLAQSLPTLRGHGMQFTVDVFNFGNMLNNHWGRDRFIPNNTFNLLSTSGSSVVDGRRLYRAFTLDPDAIFSTGGLNSRYQIQLGARYSF